MSSQQQIDREKEEKLFAYFDRDVLASYRAKTDLYVLEEDDMGGRLSVTDGNPDESRWLELLFGFRRLQSGQICIAMFGFDFERKLPDRDQHIWLGHLLQKPVFAPEDPSFERWRQRYVFGSWEVEDGPKMQVLRLVRLVRALTRQTLGVPLFRFDEHALVNYPIAENTDAYAKAHVELYRLLGDGLDPDCLSAIADKLGVTPTCPAKTFNTLKELLPADLVAAVHQPLKDCGRARNRIHGVPSTPSAPFAAFDEFQKDLLAIEQALRGLMDWLGILLGADAEQCLRRQEALDGFPRLVRSPHAAQTHSGLQQALGKTIARVDFGEQELPPEAHKAEAIVIHFTDGSAMSLEVGSNARNLSDKFDGLRPNDFHTDIMVFWAPAPGGKKETV